MDPGCSSSGKDFGSIDGGSGVAVAVGFLVEVGSGVGDSVDGRDSRNDRRIAVGVRSRLGGGIRAAKGRA